MCSCVRQVLLVGAAFGTHHQLFALLHHPGSAHGHAYSRMQVYQNSRRKITTGELYLNLNGRIFDFSNNFVPALDSGVCWSSRLCIIFDNRSQIVGIHLEKLRIPLYVHQPRNSPPGAQSHLMLSCFHQIMPKN
jgi:hypothetical protein